MKNRKVKTAAPIRGEALAPAPQQGRDKALAALVEGINRKFGENAVYIGFPRDGSGGVPEIKRIKTGSVSLDVALGGGIPAGRYTEISGGLSSTKTSQALHIIREAQKTGRVCALVDVEATTTEPFARAIGVDADSLIYSQPAGMEEATQLLLDLQKSGKAQLGVIDSLAAMSPNREQGSAMDEVVRLGIVPSLLNEFFRKYQMNNNLLAREGGEPFTLVCINQLRERIGAYGDPEYCLHYDTLVNFADGRSIPIGKVVEERIGGDVWSFDERAMRFERKPIIGWHMNGKLGEADCYYHIQTVGSGSKNGRFGITVTHNHEVFTQRGWVRADCLGLEDKLVTRYESKVNGTVGDFLWGTFVGDCTFTGLGPRDSSAQIKFQDSQNPAYVYWKCSKLKNALDFSYYKGEGIAVSESRVEFAILKKALGNRDPELFLRDHYSDMGLALWYMDDGSLDQAETLNQKGRCCICVKRFMGSPEKMACIAEAIKQRLGVDVSVYKDGRLMFNAGDANALFGRVCRFVPECMQYKLPPEFQGKYEDFELETEVKQERAWVGITLLRKASDRQLRGRGRNKYDISVSGNYCYVAGGTTNGVVVHNSPGGRGKGFAASVDLRLRKSEWISEGKGEEKGIVGQVVSFRIDKNKTYRRMQSGQFDYYFADNAAGVSVYFNDYVKDIIVCAVQWGIIARAGAWFTYGGRKWQGLEAVVQSLRSDEGAMESLYSEVLGRGVAR